jgi:hypothetical protein
MFPAPAEPRDRPGPERDMLAARPFTLSLRLTYPCFTLDWRLPAAVRAGQRPIGTAGRSPVNPPMPLGELGVVSSSPRLPGAVPPSRREFSTWPPHGRHLSSAPMGSTGKPAGAAAGSMRAREDGEWHPGLSDRAPGGRRCHRRPPERLHGGGQLVHGAMHDPECELTAAGHPAPRTTHAGLDAPALVRQSSAAGTRNKRAGRRA